VLSYEIITGFEKMSPDPFAVTKASVRLQVAPVAFL
jgi:hypothetical protein